jgi:GNAT superfamily N-acetyltransferase
LSRLLILSRPTAPGPTGSGTISVRQATGGDAPGFARDIGTYDEEGFRARLTDLNRCYLASEGDRIVHCSWCARGATWTEELQTYLAPPATDAYIYESLTVPEARGRGIYPIALRAISSLLHREGVERMWIGVEAANEASTRAILKAGFEHAYAITFDPEGLEDRRVEGVADADISLHIVTDRPTE